MRQSVTVVDAFTDRAYGGNPAAVCVLETPCEDAWMRAVAREMNLSETAFLVPSERGDGYGLRWFTPAVEVDLCGHATLASAHVLWETKRLAPEREAQFQTRSGVLTARRQGAWIELDFPATPALPAEPPAGLLHALAVAPAAVARSRFDYLLELDSAGGVRAVVPDFGLLRRVDARGVIVTARSDRPEYDVVSRFFAPAAGVDEDPVTGSAHCAIGPWWSSRLGKDEIVAFQASARGGVVRVRVDGDRVLLRGQAVTVLEGTLLA